MAHSDPQSESNVSDELEIDITLSFRIDNSLMPPEFSAAIIPPLPLSVPEAVPLFSHRDAVLAHFLSHLTTPPSSVLDAGEFELRVREIVVSPNDSPLSLDLIPGNDVRCYLRYEPYRTSAGPNLVARQRYTPSSNLVFTPPPLPDDCARRGKICHGPNDVQIELRVIRDSFRDIFFRVRHVSRLRKCFKVYAERFLTDFPRDRIEFSFDRKIISDDMCPLDVGLISGDSIYVRVIPLRQSMVEEEAEVEEEEEEEGESVTEPIPDPEPDPEPEPLTFTFTPVATFRSCFQQKSGCPRQSQLVPSALGRIKLQVGTNPSDFIDGIQDFSHLILIFVFHLNRHLTDNQSLTSFSRAKVAPPRLGGRRVGVFSTRSPYRPNPIGKSVVRLEEISGSELVVSGGDLVDGTPILDIKPYIPLYDALGSEVPVVSVPSWIHKPNLTDREVIFTDAATMQITSLLPTMQFYSNREPETVMTVISDMLRLEPRSNYRIDKEKRVREVFAFFLDELNVRCIFDDDRNEVHVIEVESRNALDGIERSELKKRNLDDAKEFFEQRGEEEEGGEEEETESDDDDDDEN